MRTKSLSSTMGLTEGYRTTTASQITSGTSPASNIFSNFHWLIHWQPNTNAQCAKSSNDLAVSLPSLSKQKTENEIVVSHSTTIATGKSNAMAFKLVRRQSTCFNGVSACDHAQNWGCHAAFVTVVS